VKTLKFILAVCGLLGISEAMATPVTTVTENFSFLGSAYKIVGQFTYDTTSNKLTAISGTVTGLNASSSPTAGIITGLISESAPTNSYPSDYYFGFDNSFDPVQQQFSFGGILFSFGSNNFGNLYFNPTPYFSTYLPDGSLSDVCKGDLFCPGDSGRLQFSTVGAVPEPATWAMVLLGFFGLAAFERLARRSRIQLTRQT
jgi:hypothetical protein